MNPKTPLLSGRKLVKIYQKLGYRKVSQKGSHIKMKNGESGIVAIIPDHKKLDRWTLKTILRETEITEKEIKKYL